MKATRRFLILLVSVLAVLVVVILASCGDTRPLDPADGPTRAQSTSPDQPPAAKTAPAQRPDWVRDWGAIIVAFLSLVVSICVAWYTARREHQRDRRDKERDQRDQELARRQQETEADRLLDQAWDLLGGEPGSDSIEHPVKDPTKRVRARRFIRDALRTAPHYSRCYHLDGVLFVIEENFEEAEGRYCRALELDRRDALAHVGLGGALAGQGKLEEAERPYRRAVELDPKSLLGHIGLASVLSGQNRLGESEGLWRRATELDPEAVEAHIGLACVLGAQKKQNEAEASLYRARKLDPDHPALRVSREGADE